VTAAGTQSLGCTITVYITGTVQLATIYADNFNTPKANPFTADSNTGAWSFYAPNGRFDIRFSGGNPSITPAYTSSDLLFQDLLSLTTGSPVLPSLGSTSANIAQSGFIQMAAGDCLSWRNNAGTADNCLTENPNDQLAYSGGLIPTTGTTVLPAGNCVQAGPNNTLTTIVGPCSPPISGFITATGSPVANQIGKFSGPTSVTSSGLTDSGTSIAALEPMAVGSFNKIITVDGVNYTTVQAAINALPSGGGTVLIPSGTYVGPTTIPTGTKLIGTGAPAAIGIAGNLVTLTYTATLTLTDISDASFENIAFDFSTATTPAGLVLKAGNGSYGNRFIRCVFNQAGGGSVPAVKLWASGGGTAKNVAFNTFEDVTIYGNNTTGSNPGPVIGVQFLGSGAVNSGAIATQNSFINTFIRGGIQGGVDLELNSDTNYFFNLALFQEWATTPTNSYGMGFNLLTPGSDQDADASWFYGVNITGGFTSYVRSGQATGSLIDITNITADVGTVVTGGTPQFSGRLVSLNGGQSEDYQDVGGNFQGKGAQTSFSNLGAPANGTSYYCPNCTIANPCAGGGTGAFAKRLNSVWVCN